MKRSHSRQSYPLDKRVPIMEKCHKVYTTYINSKGEIETFTHYEGYNFIDRKFEKELHKTKKRQYDKKLCKE